MFVLISLSNKTITDHRGTVLSVKTKMQKCPDFLSESTTVH